MKKIFFSLLLFLTLLTGCLKDNDNSQYAEWRQQNDEYITKLESQIVAGSSEYTKFTADWAPFNSVFIKWHNDRSETARNLSPLSNSTVNITYSIKDIEDNDLGDSFSMTAWGDSIYQSKPNQNILGMWIAMVNMHEGDSVTMVIPYLSGYGANSRGSIKPYSNLIYNVKMKKVVKFEK